MDIAMVERRWRLDGAVRLAVLAGARDAAAVARRIGGKAGLMEQVDERRGRNAKRSRDGETFGVDCRDDAADRRRDARRRNAAALCDGLLSRMDARRSEAIRKRTTRSAPRRDWRSRSCCTLACAAAML